MSTPWFSLINLFASSITVRFLRPRKSILRRPSSSIKSLSYCVTIASSTPRPKGTYSPIGFWPITTPAACVPDCLGRPSSLIAISIIFLTSSLSSYISLRSLLIFKANGMLSFSLAYSSGSLVGTALETLSQSAYGRSITLPTSLIHCFAARVPNVIIWATLSLPYFRFT